jgi:DNA-directed RNA polymerase subunit beta'
MAVHLPLSFEAQIEAHTLMLSIHNIFSPAHGNPIITPSQDMVLGLYYMTADNAQEKGEDRNMFSMPTTY